MDRLIEFAANHPFLVMALVGVVAAIVVNEVLNLRTAGQQLDPGEATRLYNRENAQFVDVRGENAFVTRHLPGAVNLPQAHLSKHKERLKLKPGQPVIVYCDTGRSASRALGELRKSGVEPVYQLRGGLAAWQDAGLPTEGRG